MRIPTILKRVITLPLNALGLELRVKRTDRQPPRRIPRHSLRGTLEHASKLGLAPRTVIDVGAAEGTLELYETFPQARHVLIEPLEEHRERLQAIVNGLPDAEYVIAAAGRSAGSLSLNVHRDLDGSSLYRECEDSDVNGVPRTVPVVTLDELCTARKLQGPYLIKIDVQGAELDVLAGARQTLASTEYLVLEISLFQFFVNGPQLSDVIIFMKEMGFVVYDILDYQYRPLDGAMSQVDMAFVKGAGPFRKHHFYATRAQRAAQDDRFLSSFGKQK